MKRFVLASAFASLLVLGCEPRPQIILERQHLPLQVSSQSSRGSHDGPPVAARLAWLSIQPGSSRKNWPGAASGSGGGHVAVLRR